MHTSRLSGRAGQRSSGGFLLSEPAESSRPLNASDKPTSTTSKSSDGSSSIKSSAGSQFNSPPSTDFQGQASADTSPIRHQELSTNGSANFGADSNGRRTRPENFDSGGPACGDNIFLDDDRKSAYKEGTLQRPVSVGFDSDPAQIVNLALSLSEGRRRNLTSGSHAPDRSSDIGRRISSAGSPRLDNAYSASGGSLRQFLQQQRHGSAEASPTSAASRRSQVSVRQSRQDGPQNKKFQSSGPRADLTNKVDETEISDATWARVEKARNHFELLYEYRRLLQDLPPLTSSSAYIHSIDLPRQSFPQTNRAFGRPYNPLQYIRNRKLRLRERKPVTAEADGWKDVEMVKEWVDEVRRDHNATMPLDILEYQMPIFNGGSIPIELTDGTESFPCDANSRASLIKSVGRPYNDWTFNAEDLLADAYWTHKDGNMLRIENRHGKKVFSAVPMDDNSTEKTSKGSSRHHHPWSRLHRQQQHSHQRRRSHSEQLPINGRHVDSRNDVMYQSISPTESKHRDEYWPAEDDRRRNSSIPNRSDDDSGHGQGRMSVQKLPARDTASNEHKTSSDLGRGSQHDKSLANHESMNIEPADLSQIMPKTRSRVVKQDERTRSDGLMETGPTDISTHESTQQKMRHQRMSSDVSNRTSFDSTAPPIGGPIPSIEMSLSPPMSPVMSATSPDRKKRFPAFNRLRSWSDAKTSTSTHDFGVDDVSSVPVSRVNSREPTARSSSVEEAAVSASTDNLQQPKSPSTVPRDAALSNVPSFRSIRGGADFDSRRRPFYKGGRIAEMVGSQVSKAGDKIRRIGGEQDVSETVSPVSEPAYGDSDIDDTDFSALENSPENGLSRITTGTPALSSATSTSGPVDMLRYYMNDLPSFRSPNKGEGSVRSPDGSPRIEPGPRPHLSNGQRQRSGRFERLAPPKLDMRSVSPSLSPGQSRNPSQDRDDVCPRAQRSSAAPLQSASHDRLNDILGAPGKINVVAETIGPSGLARLGAESGRPRKRPGLEKERHWSIADNETPALVELVTRRDIARVRALLLCSGVKANELARQSNERPEKLSKLLSSIEGVVDGPISAVAPTQEHVMAARMLVGTCDKTLQRQNNASKEFVEDKVSQWLGRLDTINQQITGTLAPRIRTCADAADAFTAELTTTHTLSVKQMNDSIDLVLRRRRQKSRWLSRGAWTLLEWTVLSVLWLVWLVVMLIRLVRAIGYAAARTVRWLLWL